MKKILSLLTLLIVAIGTSWANQTSLIDGATLPDVPSGTLDLASQSDFTPDANGWIVFEPNGEVRNASKSWFNALAWNTTSATVSDVSSYTAPFKTLSSVSITTVRKTERSKNMQFTGAEKFSVLGSAGNNSRRLAVSLFSISGTTQTLVETQYTSTGTSYDELLFDNLSASTTYVAYFYTDIVSGNDGNTNLAEVALQAPTGPVDPVFSLSKTSIGTDETAQIIVGSKDDLDGITLSGIAYGTSGVVTVSSAGVVTPVAAGTTTITFSSAAVDGKYNAGSGNLSITVTAPVVVTPTLTAGGYFFDESKTVEIACTDADATIKYSYDNSTWNDYTTALTITETTTVYAKAVKTGCEDSEVASATYTKFAPSEIAEVSTATTWDWTSWNQELQLTDTSTPTSTDNYTYADIAVLSGNIAVPASFAGDKIMFKGQYPVRKKKSQAGTWTIKPSVAGTIKVTFSDTGSSIPAGGTVKRYLNINGVNTEYYTERDGETSDKKTTDEIAVPAGDVVITAYGEDGETWQAIVVEKIVFTPATATTINLNASGFATYSKETDFMFAGATGYKMTLDEDAKTITGKKVTGKIAAGEGILFKGDAGATVTIVETTGATALEGNSLQGTTTASGKAVVPSICYTLSGDTFKKFTGTAFNDNKAYIESTKALNSLQIVFEGEDAGEATAVDAIAEADEAEAAPVKVIKNGKLYIGNFNVAGQQVK